LPRERSPSREKAKEIYLNSKGKIKLKDIAAELGVLDTQIRKWKSTDKWDDDLKGTLPNEKRNVPNKKNTIKKEPKLQEIIELENSELTDKQRFFAEIYVRNFNATQAAIKAGYSYESAFIIGYENLRKPKVREYIEYLKGIKRQSIMLSEEDIVEKYMRIAFSDITDFIDFGKERVPVTTKDGPIIYKDPITGKDEILTQMVNTVKLKGSWEVDGGIISEVKTSKQGTSIKLDDRLKALNWLSNYFGMNPEHRYRKEFDNKKLQLEHERFKHQKKMDESKVW
jgi:phage terminase small subunit